MDVSRQKLFLTVKDFSVSQESFDLYHDVELDLLTTVPQPSIENLPKYYESEDYISHTDGTRSIFEKVYQFVKNIALRNKLNLINHLQINRGKLLDIGAGTGNFLAAAKNNGWHTIGIEPNQKAKAIGISKGVAFVEKTDILESNSFDVITMWHVLEHVPDLSEQIIELKRLLKQNGSILVAVPNFRSFDAKHYGKFWAAYDVPRHHWHFSKTAIKKLFEKENLAVVSIIPMKFDAFYVSLLSEKYKTGNMNYIKAIVTGLKSNLQAVKTKESSSHIYVIKNP